MTEKCSNCQTINWLACPYEKAKPKTIYEKCTKCGKRQRRSAEDRSLVQDGWD